MRRTINRNTLLAAAVAGIVMTGCVKEKGIEPGSAISFSASSSEIETRTTYGADATTKQYIDWVAGDQMTILKKYGSAIQYCDYEVKTGPTASTSSSKSVARVDAVANTGTGELTWEGNGDHYFYAMYPNGSYSSNAFSGTVPATQIADANMPNGYMFASSGKITVTPTYDVKTVNLEFEPAFTAFEFTLINSGSAVSGYTFTLTSKKKTDTGGESRAKLNGAINYTIGAATPVSCNATTTTDSEKTITVSGISIDASSSKTFVITTLPNSFTTSDLFVTLTDGTPGGSGTTTKTLALDKGAFTAKLKYNISINLPTFAAYEYTFEVINPTDLSDLDGTSSTAVVRSYKSNDGGVTKTPLSWVVEGYYDTAEHAATGGDEGSLNPEDYSWLTSTIQEASPLEAIQTVDFSYSTTPETGLTDLEAEINRNIAANVPGSGAPGSSAALAINLANGSHGTGMYITESANSYIVNGPGWYKIPLVMGNGVKSNSVDVTTPYHYTGGGASGTSSAYAGTFYDYTATPITTTTTPILSKPSSFEVKWNDSAVTISNLVLCSDSEASSVSNVTKKVYWLTFQVAASGQGNAIIAVKDGSENVMWSYHIWVTDYTSSMDGSTTMSSLLGWITTEGTYSKLPARNVYLRVRQDDSGSDRSPLVLSIEVPAGPVSATVVSNGYAPYYQWGRKDPIRDRRTTFSSSVSNYVCLSHGTQDYSSNQVQIAIQNPDMFIQNRFGARAWWGGPRDHNYSRNIWCARNISTQNTLSSVNKTIYDPSPAGYSVPYPDCITSSVLSGIDRKASQGYRENKNDSKTRTTPAINDGQVVSVTGLYLWTAEPNTSQNGSTSYQNGTWNYNIAQGHALNILPMKDSSYDPTDDGVLGSGSGPNIIWQN